MTTLTPTQDSMVYQIAAQMMAAATSDADTARIDRALDLVSGVERMARPDLFLVTSATVADAAYRVHQGQCNCPDASKRDARRCKHAVAVQLFCQLERAEVDAEQSDARYELTGAAYLALVPTAALPPIVGTLTRQPYTPEQAPIADELGMGVA